MKRRRILDEVQEAASALHRSGAIDAQTMREFDALTLPHVLAAMPNVGTDEDFARHQEDRRD